MQLQERDNEMLAMLQVMHNLASSTDSEDAQEEDASESYQAQTAASITSTSDKTQLEMQRILQQLSMDFTNNRTLPSQDKSAQGARRETCKTPKEGGKLRKNISKYC